MKEVAVINNHKITRAEGYYEYAKGGSRLATKGRHEVTWTVWIKGKTKKFYRLKDAKEYALNN